MVTESEASLTDDMGSGKEAGLPRYSVDDIARLVQSHLTTTVFPTLPTTWDDQIQFTYCDFAIPQDWLWRPDRFLPVLVAVGALRLSGEILSIEPHPDAIPGYVLKDVLHPYSDLMVDRALELLAHERHSYEDDEGKKFGTHLDTLWLLDRPTFWQVTTAQGHPATWPMWRHQLQKFCPNA